MTNFSASTEFDWVAELEKTVTHSLITSFGLDFLLVKDKSGGDVDTIHNAREGIYATQEASDQYANRGKYDSDSYHKDSNFIAKGKKDKALQEKGTLRDAYRSDEKIPHKQRHLDHVIAAKEIHDDPGRVLAGLDGVKLANQDANLQSTHASINNAKSNLSINEFLNSGIENSINNTKVKIQKNESILEKLPRDTPQQQHEARRIEDEIIKDKKRVEALESIDLEEMRKKDKDARSTYEEQVNWTYYTSSKFATNTTSVIANSGMRMGVRQALGMIAAEVWFELRDRLPKIFRSLKRNFTLGRFLNRLNHTLKCIWQRIRRKLKEFIASFKDGAIAGAISSLTTTIFNIFATTSKNAIKIIRELWCSLVTAAKTFFFNPENLPTSERNRKVIGTLAIGVATVAGALVYAELLPIFTFPLGGALASFSAALVTGLLTLGLTWTLFHSPVMKRLWDMLDNSAHVHTLRQFQVINQQIDAYVQELARIEFNLDADELNELSMSLAACNSDIERNLILREEVEQRGINLPYEMGNPDSTRQWLRSLAKS